MNLPPSPSAARSVGGVVVERTWRDPDRRILVDELLEVAQEVSDKTYKVKVSREGKTWLADVDVEGFGTVHDFARTLAALDKTVREAIALAEDLPRSAEAKLRLDYEYNIGDPDLNRIAAKLRADRGRIEREAKELAQQTAAAVKRLVGDADLGVRDAAALLAVSPARVGQVAPQSAKAPRKASATAAKKARPVRRERTSA